MSSDIRSHHDLKVWQLGMELTEKVYSLTENFPREETHGLASQLRRAASSRPANSADGHARNSTKESLRPLSFAVGSLCVVETFLPLSLRLNFGDDKLIHQ